MFKFAVAICRTKDLTGGKFKGLFFLYKALSNEFHDSDLVSFLNNNNFSVLLEDIQRVSDRSMKDCSEIWKIKELLEVFLGKLKEFKEGSERSYNCYWETGDNVAESACLKVFSQEVQDRLYFYFYVIVNSIREILKLVELASYLLKGEQEESMKEFDPDVH